jgi:hypothetical protein
MRRFNKVFLFSLPLLLLIALSILGLSLNAFNRFEAGGCGCDFAAATGDFEEGETTAYFNNQPLQPPQLALEEPEASLVLGEEASAEEKWIEVDLSEQKLIAWEGDRPVFETLISSGLTGRTPTGEFRIWGKFKYTKMSGGSKQDGSYYYLPNVPYTMYFYKGYGLHGTYWHNNFGQRMSHGCVNLPTMAAERIFYWSTPTLPVGKNSVRASEGNPGTRVIVHD